MSRKPLAFSFDAVLPPPSSADKTSDAARLKDALQQAGLHPVAFPLAVLKRLPEELRRCGFSISLVIAYDEQGYRLVDIKTGGMYGIALDIGTTTIECSLYDLDAGRRLAMHETGNPQVRYGADVLSRVQAAMSGRGEGLAEALRQGINGLVATVCEKCGISSMEVYAVTVAGNTIMSHFFLGLDVVNIPLAPNIPVFSEPVFCRASDISLAVHPAAAVYVFPNAGSYVGGDIISGMIGIGMQEQIEPVLFMDVGTNLEIALGCRDWIMVGAGAAGPALEGGIADIGRKAEKGTISSVRIDRLTGEPKLQVISGGEPEGICGSGLIDLVSSLYDAGLIDQAGRFLTGDSRIIEHEGEPAYLLYASDEKKLIFREREMKNFLRSKAAMFAFLYVFLRSVGMKIGDMERIYVAGALGCGINLESAVNIGMLPDVERGKIVPSGNTSLKGASMVLTDGSLLPEVRNIARLITYREMSEDADLLNILQGALFIPHTDPQMLKG